MAKNNLKIIKNISAPTQIWNEVYEKCDYATFFHSVEFATIMNQSDPEFKIRTRLIEFSDVTKVIFILYGMNSFKGLLTNYTSSVCGSYGGWISDRELTTNHTNLLINYTKSLNIYLRTNPFDTSNPYKKLKVSTDYAQVLDINRDYTEIHKNYEYRHKYTIRKAQKAAVTFSESSSLTDWGEFYEVYVDSIKRWGDNARDERKWPFWQLLMNRPNIKLYTARYDSKIVAGAVCLLDKQKVIYYYGAYLDEYKHISPATYLLDQIIQQCAGAYAFFDFMPSGNRENLILFKKGFSPDLVHSDTFLNVTVKYRIADKVLNTIRRILTFYK